MYAQIVEFSNGLLIGSLGTLIIRWAASLWERRQHLDRDVRINVLEEDRLESVEVKFFRPHDKSLL